MSVHGLITCLALAVCASNVLAADRRSDPEYAGSNACAVCHADVYAAWRGSHHELAMQPATTENLIADFALPTPPIAGRATRLHKTGEALTITDAGGTARAVRYTFGVSPLRQYLVDFGNGRLQGHALAWDSRAQAAGGQRWFDLTPAVASPDDVLHWQGPAQSWNFMCADCHSTAVRKGYDAATRQYATTFTEVSVGCEACHGPGAAHVEAGGKTAFASADEQVCATCHSRRAQLTEAFRPGEALLDHYLPVLVEEELYFADGQIRDEVYVYGSFLQSRMHAAGVSCTDCHEPHSASLARRGDATCTACHGEDGDPRFPQARGRYANTEHHFHPDQSLGARCVACHMPARTYMQIDDRRDHQFGIPRPDLTTAFGVPNACDACHADADPDWAAGILAERKAGRPRHWGEVLHTGRRGGVHAPGALAALARGTGTPAIVRATALTLLAGTDPSVALPALKGGLTDTDPLVRIGAIRGLAGFVPAQRWYLAESLLEDPLLAVRIEAAQMLLSMLGGVVGKAGDSLNSAVAELEASQELQADRAEGQTNLANLYLARGDTDRAIAALREAVVLNPLWVPAMVNLADLYRATGKDDQGGPLLARAVSVAANSPQAQLAYGLWLVRAGRAGEALEPLRRATTLAPRDPGYVYVYAVALQSAERSDEALGVLDGVLRQSPDPGLLELALDIARRSGNETAARRYAGELTRLRGP